MKRHQLYIFFFAALIGIALGGCAMKYDGMDPGNTDTEHNIKDSPDEQGDDPTRPTNDPMADSLTILERQRPTLPDSLINVKRPNTTASSAHKIH